MADNDTPVDIQSLISSVTQNPTDPSMLAGLMAGRGPAPSLQQQAAATQTATSAPTPPPPGTENYASMPPVAAPQGGSALPPQLQQIMGGGGAPAPQVENQFHLPTQPPQQQPGPPRPTIGGLPGLIMDILKPNRNVPPGQPAPTKLDNFEKFLGNFLQSLSAGFSQEGHGPGAALRGAGAAMQAPYQQAVQQYQMGLQQSSIESQDQLRAAQEEFNRQRAREYESVTVPQIGADGKMMKDANGNPIMIQIPAKEAGPYMSRIGAAGITGAAGVQKAEIAAGTKMEVAQLQLRAAQGQATRFMPDVDKDGNRFYRVFNKYGKEIGQADVNVIPSLMTKSSNTIEYKQQEDGSYIALPKMTTTGPVIPVTGGKPGTVGVSNIGTPKAGNGKSYWGTSAQTPSGIRGIPVLAADGTPLLGKAPENIRTMALTAKATLPHMDTILSEMEELDKLGVLGEFKGKATDFLTSKGFTFPNLTPEQSQLLGKFVNDVKLMDSAMLRTHFGARGGQQMYDKFSEMLNAGEHVDLMRGSLSSFKDYLTGYSEMINTQTKAGATNSAGVSNKPPKNIDPDGVGFIPLNKPK